MRSNASGVRGAVPRPPAPQPYVLDYWRTGFTTNCQAYHMYDGQYNTDVLLNKTLTYIG